MMEKENRLLAFIRTGQPMALYQQLRLTAQFSIWAVRLTLAAALAPTMGLQGVWTAMCVELCFRGAIFLLRLRGNKWMKKI